MRPPGRVTVKQLWKKVKTGITWRLLWFVSTGIAYSVRTKAIGWERFEKLISDGKGGIIATWHGTTMLPIFCCRHRGLWAIVSKSRDGELQNRLVQSRGYKTIRGSSGAQGLRAFLEAARRIKEGAVIAITPDGPRGPAGVVQPGTVLLAGRAGCDIVPVGVAISPAWRLHSWDSHMIPKPFSRAVVVFGEPIRIAECKSDEETEACQKMIGEAMEKAVAEAWAALEGRTEADVAHI